MIIQDRVYGQQEIKEKFIIDLVNSKPMQRLKKINQHGATAYVWPEQFDVSRFEHSLGVYFLLRKLGAKDEELVAGLLHDVAHTAFSHVVDFALGTTAHNYHEQFFEKVIMDSELPSILKKHGFDVKRILDEKNFPLLEEDIPGLCADRLDYLLRDMFVYNLLTKEKIDYFLKNLTVNDNRIIMKNRESAKLIGEKYTEGNYKLWAPIFVVGQYNLLALILKSALKRNVIKEEDLFKTDDEVYEMLLKDPESEKKLKLLNPDVKYIDNPNDYDFYIRTKVRQIDPLFLEDGKLKRLSEEDSDYKEELKKLRAFVEKGFYIKIKEG